MSSPKHGEVDGMATATGTGDRTPKWRTDHPLVVCKGGPRAGAWYFLNHGDNSWEETTRQAVWNTELAGGVSVQDTVLGYVLTDNHMDHPRFDGPDGGPLAGRILLWNPTEAAARRRRKGQDHARDDNGGRRFGY